MTDPVFHNAALLYVAALLRQTGERGSENAARLAESLITDPVIDRRINIHDKIDHLAQQRREHL